jgi:hypothetical protein
MNQRYRKLLKSHFKKILRKKETRVYNRPRQKSQANYVVVVKADIRKTVLITDRNQLNYSLIPSWRETVLEFKNYPPDIRVLQKQIKTTDRSKTIKN